MKDKCTLTDKELLDKITDTVSKLAKTGGRSWSLSVPVDFNNDPDMLICELCARYQDAISYIDDFHKYAHKQ